MTSPPYFLYHGYCEDYLPLVPAGSVRAVITDPPYGMEYRSNHRPDAAKFDKIVGDEGVPVEWMRECRRLIRPDGCLLTFCHWKTAEAFRQALQGAGWTVTNQAVWDRGWDGMGDLGRMMGPIYDLIWFCAEPGFRWPNKRPSALFRHMRLSGTVLQHPTQKPLALMKELVGYLTAPGDTVLDPYAGSGSTGVAAVQMGRRFLGCEVVEDYWRLADTRLRRAAERR